MSEEGSTCYVAEDKGERAAEFERIYLLAGELSTESNLQHLHPQHVKQIVEQVWPIAYAQGKADAQRVTGETSDGYHTFNELYDHRCLLWINYVLSDGCPGKMYMELEHLPGWDLIGVETHYGQISYHVPAKFRPLYIDEPQRIVDYDGHASADVIERLMRIASDGALPAAPETQK